MAAEDTAHVFAPPSTELKMDTASACADTAPFAATHVDFGCTVCFDIIQTYYHKTPLRKLIAQHKSTRPGCFVRSALIGDAELARRLEQQCEANQSRFGDGDTKGLLDTGGEFAAFQCASCARCFREKPKADDHVRPGRTSCSGSTLLPIAARVTIFGTVCPAPPACRPTGINLHLATKEQLLAELKLRDAEADDVESTYIAPREIQPFDAKQLRKKYDYVDGEKAMAWDVANGGSYEEKLVSYSESRVMEDLPQTNLGSTVVARAARAFKDPGIEIFPGYVSGQLDLPPTCIHADYISLGSVVFVVASCQPKELEFALAYPDENDAQFLPETAQRFLLSPGDMFRVPAGNMYRIENLSKTHKCKLFWTIIRPAPEQDPRMEA